jgi:hypothetical protein
MIGQLIIAAVIIGLKAAFRIFIDRVIAWAGNIISRISLAIKATLSLKLKGRHVVAKIKVKVKGKYSPEKRTSSQTIDINELPEEIKSKLVRGNKVKVMKYA